MRLFIKPRGSAKAKPRKYFSQNVIKHKLGLLHLAAELGNVFGACEIIGLSRDRFYLYQSVLESGDVDTLIDAKRRKPNLRIRGDEAIETAGTVYLPGDQPSLCPMTICNSCQNQVAPEAFVK